jgi:hypothetical protein
VWLGGRGRDISGTKGGREREEQMWGMRKAIHEKVSNVFTKLLARTKVEYFHERLFLVENASPVEREC